MRRLVTPTKTHQGRPRNEERRTVYDSLVSAAEKCVTEHGTANVSAVDIARAAGTTYTMINYYFGSKDCLMVVVMKRAIRDMCHELRDLETTILQRTGNPTWHIVTSCIALAGKHRACSRILPNSVSDESFSHAELYKQLECTVHAQLCRILQLLIRAGIYSPYLDLKYATFTLGALANSPMILESALPMHDLSLEDLESHSWLVHVASMLDQQFRNPQRLTEDLSLEPTPSFALRAQSRATLRP
jgi:AcrR family transcriptional regulator